MLLWFFWYTMVKENISIKFLIHLVGERPTLWDKTSPNYRDRLLKETSWGEICALVNENFYSLPNAARDEFYKIIMKKWTHIRDSWVKSMKYGYDEVTKLPPKPYVYHNELKFLQKILRCKPQRMDLTKSQPSITHFEEFYRQKHETQNSYGTSQDKDGNEIFEGNQQNIAFKQDLNINRNQPKLTEAEKSDECHLTETEIPEIEAGEESPTKVIPTKAKRRSIFVNARNTECPDKKVSTELILDTPQVPSIPTSAISQISRVNIGNECRQKAEYNFIEQRHLNFFKGILPSVKSLDEDHILQFQSGVISLLQKLREYQKQRRKRVPSHSLLKGRGRKRKGSLDDDDWAISKKYVNKKSNRKTFDRIAPDYYGTETEYLSND